MGNQQLLLIIIGVLVIAVAVTVAIAIFLANSVETSRNNLIVDLGFYAQKAREYYWKPRAQGGGNRNFSNVSLENLVYSTENENGRYYVESSTTGEVVLLGVGRIISGADTIRVRMRVDELRDIVEIIN